MGPPRTAPVPPAARLPGPYWVLVAGFTLARSGAVVVPFLSLYLVTHLHHSPAEAAHVSAAFGAGWLVGPLVAGTLTDRIGRRTTLRIALLSTALSCLLLSQVRSLWALGGCAFAVGFFFDAPRPAIAALITDLVPPALRSRAFGRLYWAMNLGAAIAAAAGSLLADGHFALLFLLDAAANVAFALVLGAVREPPREPVSTASGKGRGAVAGLLRDGPFMALCAITLAWLLVYQQMLFGLPLAMDRAGLSPRAYGMVCLVNAACVLVYQPLLQPVIDRFTPAAVCTAGALFTGAGMGANLLSQDTLGYAAAAGIWTIGEVLFFAAAMTAVADLAPADARGTYAGVWGCTLGLSALGAPHMAAWAMNTGGSAALWSACALLGAAAATACAALRPAIEGRRSGTGPGRARDAVPAAS
ncbi:MFS transporter [Streptomyces sp. NPDC059991]|uniref:MFS transporter n=1 Tax=unclassified Streptomyces TaxID=2593676 RepID=UPI0036AC7F08